MSHTQELILNGCSTDKDDEKEEEEERPDSLLQHPTYLRFLLFYTFVALTGTEGASFMTGYGAAWFSGCHTVEMNDHCPNKYNYDGWNLWFNIAMTIQALISFFSAPIVGGLSDRYGRKPFIFLELLLGILPTLFMCFHNDMMVYIMLLIPSGFDGPVMNAYVADILPQELHTHAYGLLTLVYGFALLVGPRIGKFFSKHYDDHFNFYVITGMYVFDALYLWLMIPETRVNGRLTRRRKNTFTRSLKSELISGSLQPSTQQTHRTNTSTKRMNPLNSFKLCCANPIIFWIAFLYGMLVLSTEGLLDIASAVLADTFQAESSDQFGKVALLYMNGAAVGMIIGPLLVLPILSRFFNNFGVFVATTCILAVAMVVFTVLCFDHIQWMIPIASSLMGIGFVGGAGLNAILTDNSDPEAQGEAFAPVSASGALVAIFAPMAFERSYHYLKNIGIPGSIFGIAFILLLVTLVSSIGLHRAMQKVHRDRKSDMKFHPLNESVA